MRLYDLRYGPNLERRVALDLDRIIYMCDYYEDYHELVISWETQNGNDKRRFEFPSKEHRDNVYLDILRASCASAYCLPTDM